MRKTLLFLLIFFILILILVFPPKASAVTLGEIFTSPESILVRAQERIEYFFAFSTEKKVIVFEKQAERRLARAEILVKTKEVDKALSLIKSYETLKEKQGDLIEDAPTTVLSEIKERTIEQQARIEDIKKDMPNDAKEIIEDSQRTVVKTMIENSKAEEGEGKATEFAEEVKNVLDPGSNIFAPGSNVVLEVAPEVAPGGSEVAPGSQDIKPGNTDLAP